VKVAARLVGIAGAVALAWLLVGGGPKDLTLVYDVSSVPGARAVELEVVRDGKVLRRAEFRLAPSDHGRVAHKLELPKGAYLLRGRIEGPDGATPFERPLDVEEAGTIVLPLGR
jgi:hypothetical protein